VRAWLLLLALLAGPVQAQLLFPEDVEPSLLVPVVEGQRFELGAFWQTDGQWTSSAEQWAALGVVLQPDESGYLSAEQLGVSLVVQEETGTVLVSIPSHRLPVQRAEQVREEAPIAPPAPGVLVNYSVGARVSADHQAVSIGHEVRFPLAGGVMSTTGQAVWDSKDGVDYERGLTQWQRDDMERQLTYQLGDVITSGPSPVVLGGVRIAKDPGALDPLTSTYAIPVLGGLAVDPGEVRVLANEAEVLRQEVGRGPFSIDNYGLSPGANDTSLVVRDEFGREIVLSEQTLYFAPTLLRDGLWDWEVAAGAVREGQDYGEPGVAARVSYGASDDWTVHGRLQADRQHRHAVVGATTVLGEAGGVLDVEVGQSSGPQGKGRRMAVAYDYRAADWSVRVEHERNENWWQLGPEGRAQVEERTRVQAMFRPNREWSVRAGLSEIKTADTRSRFADVGAMFSRGQHALGANVLYDFEEKAPRVELGYRYTFGNNSGVGVRARASDRGSSMALSGYTTADVQGRPVRLAAEAAHAQRGTDLRARADWDTSLGRARVELARPAGGDVVATGSFSGALHVSGTGIATLPRAPAAYAIVDVPGQAGVPVLVNNRPVGKTDKHGRLLVGHIAPLTPSEVKLDTRALPLEVQIGSPVQRWTAPRGGSIHVVFPVLSNTARAFVVMAAGAPVAVDTVMRSGEQAEAVGYEGVFFLQTATPGQVWEAQGLGCSVRVPDTLPRLEETLELECLP
jgi:outer membrane usher protein FimD/PapC